MTKYQSHQPGKYRWQLPFVSVEHTSAPMLAGGAYSAFGGMVVCFGDSSSCNCNSFWLYQLQPSSSLALAGNVLLLISTDHRSKKSAEHWFLDTCYILQGLLGSTLNILSSIFSKICSIASNSVVRLTKFFSWNPRVDNTDIEHNSGKTSSSQVAKLSTF